MSEAMTPAPTLQVVDIEDGPVTVTTITYLEALSGDKQAEINRLGDRVKELENEAAEMQLEAGRALTSRSGDWSSTEWNPRIEAARGLEQLVSNLKRSIDETVARPHHGIGGLFQSLRDRHEAADLESKVQSATTELNNRYRSVADGLEPATGIADVDNLLTQFGNRKSEIANQNDKSQQLTKELQLLSDELKRRKDIQTNLGFDALGLQADLIANGLRPVSANLVLKSKEIAVASSPATLCRYKTRTQFVGGSHGFSIPLGHGFRYRVSSFRGHPIQTDVLAQLDVGTLVITNQRLVFLGTKRDVSTPAAKLLQVEPFSNGIGVSREGKEARDIYLVPRPAYILLYLQWVVARAA